MATTTRRGRKTTTTSAARREAAANAKAALLDRLAEFDAAGDHDAAIIARIEHFATRYSARNATLIVMQNPDATEVHGYREWQTLGRQVRKGESGIQILAPAGTSSSDGDDKPTGDGEEKKRQFFRLAFVFDVAQTDPIAATAAA